jgi:hypothetical protein
MKEKKIILILGLFLLISFFYLAFMETRQADPNYQKNWWVVYFDNPKDSSISFVIENHSDQNNFHWEVFQEKEKLQEKDTRIPKGESATIDSVNLNDLKGKIIISVSDGKEKKEIYKQF